jgi:hypothetical protein
LIKGWAIARLYPPDKLRRPGDIDLAVSHDDFEAASSLRADPDVSKFNIDLHDGLRTLDTVSWDDVFLHSQLVDLEDEKIRILRNEDHLRLLCVHWLFDGGRYKDKLWDIYYAVAHRPSDFDWDRCLNVVSRNRRGWVICAIALAHHYLDLRISDLPFRDEASTVPQWILKCVEKEWRQPYHFESVLTSTHDRHILLNQIGRRLPPNPIRATIEAEGDLYGSKRSLYQLKLLKSRARPFMNQLIGWITYRPRRRAP